LITAAEMHRLLLAWTTGRPPVRGRSDQ